MWSGQQQCLAVEIDRVKGLTAVVLVDGGRIIQTVHQQHTIDRTTFQGAVRTYFIVPIGESLAVSVYLTETCRC